MSKKATNAELSPLTVSDYEQLIDVMNASDPFWQGNYLTISSVAILIQKFPEGQLAVKVNGKPVACAFSIIIDYDKFSDNHSYEEITAQNTFETHNTGGNVLYGIGLFVSPEYRLQNIGHLLSDARKELCEKLNLSGVVFGARTTTYNSYMSLMGPKEYLKKVREKEIYDPVLSFEFANDFHARKILKHYLPDSRQAIEYTVLLKWDNIYYTATTSKKSRYQAHVKMGLVQWQMRPFNTLHEVFKQTEFFIRAIASNKCDFVLFPELFNAPLLASYNKLTEAEAVRELAKFTPLALDNFKALAIKYKINIITGSMPSIEGETVKNIGYICHRNGLSDEYEKLHVSDDKENWGITGGNKIRVFDTDVCKIGVLVGCDVQFPELGRILADMGMKILFVPYLCDSQNAYMRLRYCAQARAIENECFVAITGSSGNLSRIKNIDIPYSQSAIFTPCDYQFPGNGIKAEAPVNTEAILTSEINLNFLEEIQNQHTSSNLKARRQDLYEVKLKQ
ncbi:MAG: carbon-nitrogen hydrolase family protein [Bacteroidetes bacterium]|nr:carbon-nitrogen hydrolase family protein [Bacteroidota bacterium]